MSLETRTWLVLVYDKFSMPADAYILSGKWEEVSKWLKENYSNVAAPHVVVEPKPFRPFEGWDVDDSEFGPYTIYVLPVSSAILKEALEELSAQGDHSGPAQAVEP